MACPMCHQIRSVNGLLYNQGSCEHEEHPDILAKLSRIEKKLDQLLRIGGLSNDSK